MADSPRVRVVPFPNDAPRVETGAVQFGNDWPGLFVRGDEAFGLAHDIDTVGRFLDSLPGGISVGGGWAVADARTNLRDLARVVRDEVTLAPHPPGK
ncbi:MAG: hypothetical protein K2X82_31290 [Gemmataceae bacterium]|nr:hypothetical protein [Gemmataceae bacterium]